MELGAHIFIVTPETYEVHRDYRFCAVGKLPKDESGNIVPRVPVSMEEFETSPSQKSHHSLIADLWNVCKGDVVFFYVTNRGFTGVYRVTSAPFFDPTSIDGVIGPERPFRLLIEPIQVLDHPVPEEYLFRTNESQNAFWVWYFAKMRNRPRAIHTIDPDGRDKLIELLLKQNHGLSQRVVSKRYPGNRRYELCDIRIAHQTEKGKCALEDSLRAEILKKIRDQSPSVRLLAGQPEHLEWFANNVPYHVSGRNIDILLFHRALRFSEELPISPRVQFSVVELKRGDATSKDLEQLLGYCEWVGAQLAGGELHTVQPVLVAHRFPKEAAAFADTVRTPFRDIKLIEYKVQLGELKLSLYGSPLSELQPRPPQVARTDSSSVGKNRLQRPGPRYRAQ